MKVGGTYSLRNPPAAKWFKPWSAYYGEALDHMQEMERLGFHSISFAEHHFDPDGYNPSMFVMLTAAAMRTSRVQLGQNILQMPYHHPVRVAEDLATIDILSGGRVFLGVGGGAWDDEALAFGINPRTRYSQTTESLEIIRKCWTEDCFSYEGKRFQLQNVRVYPKPLQRPHPEMYVTALKDNALDRAARLGLNVIGHGGTGLASALGDAVAWNGWYPRFRAAMEKHGRRPEDVKISTHGILFVCDDPERELARHKEALLYGVKYTRFNGRQPYNSRYGKPIEDATDLPVYFRTPDDAVKNFRDVFSQGAPDQILMAAHRPGIPFADSLEYHRLFAEKVLPHLRDLPAHA